MRLFRVYKSDSVKIKEEAYDLSPRKEKENPAPVSALEDLADAPAEDTGTPGPAAAAEAAGTANTEEKAKTAAIYEEAARIAAEARGSAGSIINEAKRVAETIINNTLDNTRERLNKAIADGYAFGKEEGKREAEILLGKQLERLRQLADSITEAEDRLFEEFRDDMFEIIKRIAERVINREIDRNDDYLLDMFRGAVEDIKRSDTVTVTVSESEIVTVTKHREAMMEIIGGVKDFRLIPDKNLPKGTLIIESESGVVDASVKIQTEKANALLESMKEDLFAEL